MYVIKKKIKSEHIALICKMQLEAVVDELCVDMYTIIISP